MKHLTHRIAGQLDPLAPHQVLHVHGPKLRHVDPPAHHLIHSRHGLEFEVRRGKKADDLAQPLSRSARNGDESLVGIRRIGDSTDFGDRSGHANAANVSAPFRPLVIHKSHDPNAELGAVFNLPGQRFAGIAGPNDQHALLLARLYFCPPESILPHANGHARAEQRQERERPVDQQDAAWLSNELIGHVEQWPDVPRHGENREGGRLSDHQADDIADPDVPPPSFIKTEECARQELHAHHHRQTHPERRKIKGWNVKLESQLPGEHVTCREYGGVEEKQRGDPASSEAEKTAERG